MPFVLCCVSSGDHRHRHFIYAMPYYARLKCVARFFGQPGICWLTDVDAVLFTAFSECM